MAAEVSREPARDPQDLERLLVSRQRAGDIDGMVALYEPNAVLDSGAGRLTLGKEAIGAFYAGLVMHCRGRPGTHINPPPGWQCDRRGRPPTRRRDMAVGHRSVLHGVAGGGELRRVGNFQRAQRDLRGEDACRKEKDC